jgi:hypothetical protein
MPRRIEYRLAAMLRDQLPAVVFASIQPLA